MLSASSSFVGENKNNEKKHQSQYYNKLNSFLTAHSLDIINNVQQQILCDKHLLCLTNPKICCNASISSSQLSHNYDNLFNQKSSHSLIQIHGNFVLKIIKFNQNYLILDKNQNIECSCNLELSKLSLSQKQISSNKQAEAILFSNKNAFLNDFKINDKENNKTQKVLTKTISLPKKDIYQNSCFPAIVTIFIKFIY